MHNVHFEWNIEITCKMISVIQHSVDCGHTELNLECEWWQVYNNNNSVSDKQPIPSYTLIQEHM